MYQSPDFPGNRGIEGDNSEYDPAADAVLRPRPSTTSPSSAAAVRASTNPTRRASSCGAARADRSTTSWSTNFYSPCMELNDADTQAQADAGNLTMNGILC